MDTDSQTFLHSDIYIIPIKLTDRICKYCGKGYMCIHNYILCFLPFVVYMCVCVCLRDRDRDRERERERERKREKVDKHVSVFMYQAYELICNIKENVAVSNLVFMPSLPQTE